MAQHLSRKKIDKKYFSVKFKLQKDDKIAKKVFHRVAGPPKDPKKFHKDWDFLSYDDFSRDGELEPPQAERGEAEKSDYEKYTSFQKQPRKSALSFHKL